MFSSRSSAMLRRVVAKPASRRAMSSHTFDISGSFEVRAMTNEWMMFMPMNQANQSNQPSNACMHNFIGTMHWLQWHPLVPNDGSNFRRDLFVESIDLDFIRSFGDGRMLAWPVSHCIAFSGLYWLTVVTLPFDQKTDRTPTFSWFFCTPN